MALGNNLIFTNVGLVAGFVGGVVVFVAVPFTTCTFGVTLPIFFWVPG